MSRAARWRSHALILALLLVGALLRFADFGRLPAGLYHDEAQHGLDALEVLGGETPLYFTANNGREPLYIYLVAASVGRFGRSPWAVRLPAFFVGWLTLAATYDLARQLWGGRAARWALAVLAVTFWHVHLSRVAFRAVLLPLFTALFLAQAVRAVRRDAAKHWAAAGFLYGAAFYTYTAVRFTPVAIGLFFHAALLCRREATLRHWRRARWGAATALLAAVPLIAYAARHPDQFLLRTDQVSIFNPAINGGDLWGTLVQHTLRTAGMFFVRGDFIWRHNLALRPVWRAPIGLAFIFGLLLLGRALLLRERGAMTALLVLLWTGVMLLPTLLAEDAPHFLRSVGVLPTAALIPAYGLARLEHWAGGRKRLLRLLPALLVAAGGTLTAVDYFVRYAQAPQSYFWFEGGAVEAAGTINAQRGLGWDGERMRHGPPSGWTIAADPQLWGSWTAVPFLVPEEAVRFEEPARLRPRTLFVAWPYRDWAASLRPRLPHPALVGVHAGPQAQGDRDPEPIRVADFIFVDAPPAPAPPLARFAEGIVLQQLATVRRGDGFCVRMRWRAEATPSRDYTVFVHDLRERTMIAQHDGPPAYGLRPTSTWRAGDWIEDEHCLAAPPGDHLRIGLYDAAMHNLALVDEQGTPLAPWFEVALP